ncbi:MAG: hypothetical protein ABW185_15265 [Sedimenticola sp.]
MLCDSNYSANPNFCGYFHRGAESITHMDVGKERELGEGVNGTAAHISTAT